MARLFAAATPFAAVTVTGVRTKNTTEGAAIGAAEGGGRGALTGNGILSGAVAGGAGGFMYDKLE